MINEKETHLECPDCGSSDGRTKYYDPLHYFCFVCNTFTPIKDTIKITNFETIQPDKIRTLQDRGIDRQACEKFGVWINDKGEHVYPYYNSKGQHVANKIRTVPNKGFYSQGDINEAVLFGQYNFPPGSFKQITITEGEADAMAVYQMQGFRYPVVSVKGASSAARDVAHSFEYLNSFETICLCFDKDEAKQKADGSTFYPGQEAAQKVASLFELGKVRVLTLREGKDANEYLKKGLGKEFEKEWWAAPVWTPEGLRFAKDLWEEVSEERNYETIDYPWIGLNKLTYGIRLGELVVFHAPQKVGKTQTLREIVFKTLKNTDKGIGLLSLEETNRDTTLGLMSLEANKPLHLPDVREQVSKEELKIYFNSVFNDERVILWDHFGASEISTVLSKIRHMVALGCKYIILDHFTIIVSDQKHDERKSLDEISTKIKMLCMELNIAVLAIVHENRKGEVRGTAGIEQVANIVIKLDRNKLDTDEWRRNVIKVVVQDNRFCGRTGPACYLYYSAETGRMIELSEMEIKQYESKTSKEREEEWI